MTLLVNLLQDNLKVTPTEDDQITISVTLPSEYLHHYIQLLNSLTGFTQIIKRQARLAKAKDSSYNVEADRQSKLYKEQYHARIVKLFDQYTSQGLNRNSSIKKIGADLRKEKHPWSSPDLVRFSLGAAGRPGRPGRPRRKQS
ncbi:MAG: hypothetical protein QM483_00615 [Desulfuromusa sp.]